MEALMDLETSRFEEKYQDQFKEGGIRVVSILKGKILPRNIFLNFKIFS